jgi:hypothetical protein
LARNSSPVAGKYCRSSADAAGSAHAAAPITPYKPLIKYNFYRNDHWPDDCRLDAGYPEIPVPQVASEATTRAYKSAGPHQAHAPQSSARASETPFDSLLDDGAQAPASQAPQSPPAPAGKTSAASKPDLAQPPAKNDGTEAAQPTGKAQSSSAANATGATDATDTTNIANAAAADPTATPCKVADDDKAKSDAKLCEQPKAGDDSKSAGDAKPADVPMPTGDRDGHHQGRDRSDRLYRHAWSQCRRPEFRLGRPRQ